MSRRRARVVVAVLLGLASASACRSTARPPEAPPPPPVPVAAASPPTPAAEAAAAGVTIATPAALDPAIASRHVALSADALPPDEVGYYMDIQQARLQQLALDGLSVTRDGSSIVLTLGNEPVFESGSSRLTPAAAQALADVGTVLSDYDKTVVSVHGHTDATGSDAVNRDLSERRALAVSRGFLDRGVAARRLVVVGHGSARPVASNDTEDGRRRNRRIDIRLDPITR